ERLAFRVGSRPVVEGLLPRRPGLLAAVEHGTGAVEYLGFDREVDLRAEAEQSLRGRHLFGAEGRAVDLPSVAFGGSRPSDDRAQGDKGRPVGGPPRFLQRAVQRVDVFVVLAGGGRAGAPIHRLYVPAVRLVAGDHVFADGDAGVVLDRDLVVVPGHGEVAELLVPGEGAGLMADALL